MFAQQKKKKPGLDVMVAVGKPKESLDAPEPVDAEPKPKMPKPDVEHEQAETPQHEGNEEYGAKLIADMSAPLIEAGLDESDAKEMLGRMFEAAAKCLRGGGSEESAEPAGEMFDEGEFGR